MQGGCVHRVLREGRWRLGLAEPAAPQPEGSTWHPEGRAVCLGPRPTPTGPVRRPGAPLTVTAAVASLSFRANLVPKESLEWPGRVESR